MGSGRMSSAVMPGCFGFAARSPASPCRYVPINAASRGLIPLCQQSGQQPGEYIPRATLGHARVAGGVEIDHTIPDKRSGRNDL